MYITNVYEVTTTFDDVIVKSKVTIKDTVFADDFTKMHKNQTQYSGTFIDTLGRTLPANSPVEININGVFYTRYTDDKGVARMNINLNPGNYIATILHNGLLASSTVKVLPILNAKDVSMKYRDGTKFEATLLDGKGKPFANQTIIFNIRRRIFSRG